VTRQFLKNLPKEKSFLYYQVCIFKDWLRLVSGTAHRCLIHKTHLRVWHKFWKFSLKKYIQLCEAT
jgi:hypothetical protein